MTVRRSFPLSFIPLVPYPPLRGTFPSRGSLTIRGYRHLKCGKAATRALSPSYQSTHSSFLPPSFGRRCPEGAEVGSRSGFFTRGDANPASLRSSAPSRGRGVNDFEGSTDSIVVICGQGLALPPHMPRTSPLSSSVFHAAGALSAPVGHLPLEGKADDTRTAPAKKRRSRLLPL